MKDRSGYVQNVVWKTRVKPPTAVTVDSVSRTTMSEQNDFEKELEKVRREADQKATEPLYSRLDQKQKWIIGISLFFLGGMLGVMSNPDTPANGFFVIGSFFVAITWVLITETGIAFRRSISDSANNQQQQQQTVSTGSDSGPTDVCQDCGWQNPVDNNYCHDCGNEI